MGVGGGLTPPPPVAARLADMTRVLYNFGQRVLPALAERFPEVEFVEIPGEGELPEGLTGEVLVTSTLGSDNLAEILERGVQWLHVMGTGVDRFPLGLLGDQTMTCSRGASAVPIAEWALAHILTFEKNLPEVWLDQKPEQWFIPADSAGTLVGQRLAMVGLGAIATETARRALAFGMEVVALRRTGKASALPEIAVADSLGELLGEADHILLACALTDETRELAGREFFELCRPGAHLLNVARGELVDETALREALDSGQLAMASLDTASGEPLPEQHWLYDHPRVRLTPHISWSEPDAFERITQDFVDNLGLWLAGEPLVGVVDVAAGY